MQGGFSFRSGLPHDPFELQDRDRTSTIAHIASNTIGIKATVRFKVQPAAISCRIVRAFGHIGRLCKLFFIAATIPIQQN